MLGGSSLNFTGTVVQTAAKNSNMFIGDRFLTRFRINFTCVAGPSLLFKLARPSKRGMFYLELIVQCTLVRRGHHRGMDNIRSRGLVHQLIKENSIPHSGCSSAASDHFRSCYWSTRVP